MVSVLELRADAAVKRQPHAAPMAHLPVLDGWRGVSILIVLAAHLLPLGPKAWTLNIAAGALGMALFFNLSGYLITATLLRRPQVLPFLVRRMCRILPLLWLTLLLLLPAVHAPARVWLPSFLCYANLSPFFLLKATGHLWSVGVEMQFYLFIAFLFAALGRRALYALPAVALAITLGRVWMHDPMSVVTVRRADEIVAGALLLMAQEGMLGRKLPQWIRRLPTALWGVLTVGSCMWQCGALQYLRPYLAVCLLGSILWAPAGRVARALEARWLVYLASISYAVYVLHGGLFHLPWFEPASKLKMYARRPMGLLLVWGLAHLSTRHYEAWWIVQGKRWSNWRPRPAQASTCAMATGSAR